MEYGTTQIILAYQGKVPTQKFLFPYYLSSYSSNDSFSTYTTLPTKLTVIGSAMVLIIGRMHVVACRTNVVPNHGTTILPIHHRMRSCTLGRMCERQNFKFKCRAHRRKWWRNSHTAMPRRMYVSIRIITLATLCTKKERTSKTITQPLLGKKGLSNLIWK